MVIDDFRRCKECNDPTKYVVGMWDGIDHKTGNMIGGAMTDCRNYDCPVKKQAEAAAKASDEERARIRQENADNGISAEDFRKDRINAGLTIKEAADYIGAKPATYSSWEHERLAIPIEVFMKLEELFEDANVEAAGDGARRVDMPKLWREIFGQKDQEGQDGTGNSN